jgi:hypothetical protein
MKRCSRCVLPEAYPNTFFDEEGVCNHCLNHRDLVPMAHSTLLDQFERAKKRSRGYDALVPLSGGKDSTYVLYLATKVYGLRVLAYTFDNGFLSETALRNIESAVRRAGVDHLFFRPNWDTMRRLYRSTLLKSGELCSACGIQIVHGSLKVSADWDIPLILMGSSPVEAGCTSPENIYDVNRFKAIVADAGEVSDDELRRFLLYPDLTPDRRFVWTMLGRFGWMIEPGKYRAKQTEAEIAKLLSEVMGWQDRGKHSDCWAEPFSNLVRELRHGYSRRACQLSNLIRARALSRGTALALLSEHWQEEAERRDMVFDRLGLSASDLDVIASIPPYPYERYVTAPSGLVRQLRVVHRLALRVRSRVRRWRGVA